MSPAVRALAFAASAAGGAALGGTFLHLVRGPRWQRPNFRGRQVSLAEGLALVVGLLVSGAVCWLRTPVPDGMAAAQRRVSLCVLLVVFVAGAVGLSDDLSGDRAVKGFRGHLRALGAGQVTSGLGKLVAIGLAALGAAALLRAGAGVARLLLDAGVIAGSANVFNLLDLRPGRALKVALLCGAPLALFANAAAALPATCVIGVSAGVLPADLRERGMLGDGGANAVGGALGGCAAAALPMAAAVATLVAVVLLTAVSEVVSFSRVIEHVPPLRWADGLGRRG